MRGRHQHSIDSTEKNRIERPRHRPSEKRRPAALTPGFDEAITHALGPAGAALYTVPAELRAIERGHPAPPRFAAMTCVRLGLLALHFGVVERLPGSLVERLEDASTRLDELRQYVRAPCTAARERLLAVLVPLLADCALASGVPPRAVQAWRRAQK